MFYLRQSTASQEVPLGTFVDATDGDTPETGLTIANTDIKIWKTGAISLVSKNSGGATHIATGNYYAVLDATDSNTLGPLVIFVHVSGARVVNLYCCVLTANVYDSLIAGSDLLDIEISALTTAVGAIKTQTDKFVFTITNKVDAAIVSGASFIQDAADKIWASAARTLTSFGFSVTIGTNGDKTGYTLSTAGILAIWHQLLSAVVTSGTVGKLVKDNLDVQVSTRASQSSLDALDLSDLAAIKAITDQLLFDGDSFVKVNTQNDVIVGTNSDKTGYSLSSAGIDAILDDAPSGELTSIPSATATLRLMLQFLYTYFRNKRTVTSSTETLFKNDSSTSLGTSALSDDGTTFTKGKIS